MLKAPERVGTPEDLDAKTQTKSWNAGGRKQREERDPCIGYQRPLVRAASPGTGILPQWETTSLGALERLGP